MNNLKVWTIEAYVELLNHYKSTNLYLSIGRKIERLRHNNNEKETSFTVAFFTTSSPNNIRLELELLYFDDEFSDFVIGPLEKIVEASKRLPKRCKIFAGYVSTEERSLSFAFNPLKYLKLIEIFEGDEKKSQAEECFMKIFNDLGAIQLKDNPFSDSYIYNETESVLGSHKKS